MLYNYSFFKTFITGNLKGMTIHAHVSYTSESDLYRDGMTVKDVLTGDTAIIKNVSCTIANDILSDIIDCFN